MNEPYPETEVIEERIDSVEHRPEPDPQYRHPRRHQGYRSFFWPIVLVGVGVLWLMVNLGTISAENLTVLLRLWPLILILLGLDLLFGRRSPAIGALLGMLAVGAVIYLVINGPAMGLTTEIPQFEQEIARPNEIRSEVFVEPINGAESADITLELGWQRVEVYAVDDPIILVEADLDYLGDIDFSTSGSERRSITIGERNFNLGAASMDVDDTQWNIGINTQPAIDLTVEMGINEGDIDLHHINLNRFNYQGALGDVEIVLPAPDSAYTANIEAGLGDTSIEIEDGAELEMFLNGGVGNIDLEIGDEVDLDLDLDPSASSVTISVPGDAPVRVEVESSSGGELEVPDDYIRVEEGEADSFFSDETGIWESPQYSDSDHAITITIHDIGIGSVDIEN